MVACLVCENQERGVTVARLVHFRHENGALSRGAVPHEAPPAAHRQAAGYWHARTATPQLGPRAHVEAGYHLHQAGELAAEAGVSAPADRAAPPPLTPKRYAARLRPERRHLRSLGLASAAGRTAVFLAVEASHSLSAPSLTSAERPDQPAVPAPLTQADQVRDQAAAWVASQVATSAIVACDPAMCSVLVRYGFPAANLLVLRPGAPDPLGSAVVLATPAVRAMFGSRLVTVYAPQTLASFGTGTARVDVRAVAPDGRPPTGPSWPPTSAPAGPPGSSCWPTPGSPSPHPRGLSSPPAVWTPAC
jgi:hypothetical protein